MPLIKAFMDTKAVRSDDMLLIHLDEFIDETKWLLLRHRLQNP